MQVINADYVYIICIELALTIPTLGIYSKVRL